EPTKAWQRPPRAKVGPAGRKNEGTKGRRQGTPVAHRLDWWRAVCHKCAWSPFVNFRLLGLTWTLVDSAARIEAQAETAQELTEVDFYDPLTAEGGRRAFFLTSHRADVNDTSLKRERKIASSFARASGLC